MNKPFNKKLIESIREASRFDSGNLTAPVAILWPDPERQWEPIIGKLQDDMPGVAKADLKNLSRADPVIAPLMEYQYTGAMWVHRNGKEWSPNGSMQNRSAYEEEMNSSGNCFRADGETRIMALEPYWSTNSSSSRMAPVPNMYFPGKLTISLNYSGILCRSDARRRKPQT